MGSWKIRKTKVRTRTDIRKVYSITFLWTIFRLLLLFACIVLFLLNFIIVLLYTLNFLLFSFFSVNIYHVLGLRDASLKRQRNCFDRCRSLFLSAIFYIQLYLQTFILFSEFSLAYRSVSINRSFRFRFIVLPIRKGNCTLSFYRQSDISEYLNTWILYLEKDIFYKKMIQKKLYFCEKIIKLLENYDIVIINLLRFRLIPLFWPKIKLCCYNFVQNFMWNGTVWSFL